MSTTVLPSIKQGPEAPAVVREARRETIPPITLGTVVGVELRKMFDTRSGFWLMMSIGILSVVATGATILFAPDDALTYGNFAAAIGFPMAVVLPMVAITARITMLDISQKPERVSNILRSSTPMMVCIGMGSYVVRSARAFGFTTLVVGVRVAVLMLLLLA